MAYKQQTFAALSSGGWPSEMSAPAWQFLVRAVFQVADFALHPQMVDGAQECGGFFYKSTSPTHEGSTLVTQAPRQNPHFQTLSSLGLRIWTQEFGGVEKFRP